MKLFFFFILLLIPSITWAARSKLNTDELAKIKVLEERIMELEKRQQDVVVLPPENVGPVHSFFKDELYFGGFFEPAYSLIEGPNTNFQAAEVQSVLGLNISATFSNRLRFVTQFLTALSLPIANEHNDPRASTVGLPGRRSIGSYSFGALIAQGFIEFRTSDHFKIQGGIGYVPFGYSFQRREPVLFERRGGASDGPNFTTSESFVVWGESRGFLFSTR